LRFSHIHEFALSSNDTIGQNAKDVDFMSAGTVTYSSYSSSANQISLENEVNITPVNGGATVLLKLNLDATAQPQTDVVTISATLPGSDTYYQVTIDDYTTNAAQTFTYLYKSSSSDTAPIIAASLAALINAATPNRPDVSAKPQAASNANKIDVVSQLPGTNGAFTLTVAALVASTNAAATGTPISTATTAGTGTGKMRSILEFTAAVVPTPSTAQFVSYPELQITGSWYNGANPAVLQSSISLTQFTGPIPLDTLRNVA